MIIFVDKQEVKESLSLINLIESILNISRLQQDRTDFPSITNQESFIPQTNISQQN